MIDIDGSWGEGGGQILRMSVALSAVTGKEVRISRIRAGRPKPGLAAQHLTSIRSVAKICDAKTEGLDIGSQTVLFRPGEIRGGKYRFDIGTAGSITLVFQACFIPALHASTKTVLTVTGGTDVRWSPPIDYFQNVFLPVVEKMGVFARIERVKRGYYPKGGGKVVLHIEPRETLNPIVLERQEKPLALGGIAHVGNLPPHIPDRMRKSAEQKLAHVGEMKIQAETYTDEKAFGQGGGLVVWGKGERTFLGGDSIAERGVRAEKVGENAAEELLKEIRSGATLDVHLSDQVLSYMAMADGESTFLVRELTKHTETNMWLIQHFFDVDFDITGVGSLHKINVRPKRP